MRVRTLVLIACLFILITTSIAPPFLATGHQRQGPWLDDIDGVQVLHVIGTPYEMGYQQGTLLKEKALQDERAILATAEKYGYTTQELQDGWNHSLPYIPPSILQEMQGLADSANITLEEVAIANMVPSFMHCSVFAAWGPATTDHKLYYARSFDFPLTIIDPQTKTPIQDNTIIVIRESTNGHASISPSFPGLIGTVGGFNDQGIATAVLSCWSNDETRNGTPMSFRQQTVLDYATNITEANAILNANRTEGWNFILADSKTPIAYAVEQTATTLYQGTWDDPIEATRPFTKLPYIVRRTNIFIDPDTAATQRDRYDPHILPLLSFLTGKSKLGWFIVPAYLPWRHYQTLTTELQNHWANLNTTTSMSILRSVYNGTADPVFHAFVTLRLYCTPNQWTACPETGDLLFSCAHGRADAWRQPIHHFTLQELLNHTP
jgi:hypothetical protein